MNFSGHSHGGYDINFTVTNSNGFIDAANYLLNTSSIDILKDIMLVINVTNETEKEWKGVKAYYKNYSIDTEVY